MLIIGCFVALATVCGVLAAPWRWSVQHMVINARYILVIAGLSQFTALTVGGPTWLPLVGVLLVAAWITQNMQLPGMYLLLAGVVANGLMMASHSGAMPLAPEVAAQLGLVPPANGLLPHSKGVIGTTTLWRWLADWLIIRTPWMTLVASPGDICILLALIRWIYTSHATESATQSTPLQWIVHLYRGVRHSPAHSMSEKVQTPMALLDE